MTRVLGPEAARAYRQRRLDSGFIDQYLSGDAILDIGYRGEMATACPITERAIGVASDYAIPPQCHAPGCYKIKLVTQRIARPSYGVQVGWSKLAHFLARYYAEGVRSRWPIRKAGQQIVLHCIKS